MIGGKWLEDNGLSYPDYATPSGSVGFKPHATRDDIELSAY